MNYRKLGKTGLMVSEIGLGGEWLERHDAEEVKQVVRRCQEAGINILDCWMSEPGVRTNIGSAIAGSREKWYIQGHIGSTWQDGQYVHLTVCPHQGAAQGKGRLPGSPGQAADRLHRPGHDPFRGRARRVP